jgi:anti-sigma B factor antagonist
MEIDFTQNNGTLTVTLTGRLDTVTAPDLERFLAGKYDRVASVVIDCEKLIYISSAGLRVLLSAQKKMKGAMKLTGVCEPVMEIFEMTGFATVLSIEP